MPVKFPAATALLLALSLTACGSNEVDHTKALVTSFTKTGRIINADGVTCDPIKGDIVQGLRTVCSYPGPASVGGATVSWVIEFQDSAGAYVATSQNTGNSFAGHL